MRELPKPPAEERMGEIKEYLRFLIEKVKRKDMKGISPTIYIADVEFLLGLIEMPTDRKEDRPLLLPTFNQMDGSEIDKLVEKEIRKAQEK